MNVLQFIYLFTRPQSSTARVRRLISRLTLEECIGFYASMYMIEVSSVEKFVWSHIIAFIDLSALLAELKKESRSTFYIAFQNFHIEQGTKR